MMGVISILRNNVHRYLARKNYIMIMLAITIVSVFLAVFFTARMEIKGNIALVADTNALMANVKAFNVTVMDKAPALSDLVLNRYDAVVTDRGNGNFEIKSIKSAALEEKLRQAILHPEAPLQSDHERGIGANILGYLIFGILLQGMMYMMLYSDDKESGAFRRIAATPVGAVAYLFAHSVTNFLLIILPTFGVLVAAKEVFGINIGFTYLQYAGLIALLALLSTAFALLLSTLMKRADDMNMLGSSIITLTTLLAGSFVSFSSTRPLFDAMIGILPQKSFLTLVQGLEQGAGLAGHTLQLVYLLVLPAALFGLSVAAVRRSIRNGASA